MSSVGEIFRWVSSRSRNPVTPKIYRVMIYVHENFNRPIRVEHAASLIGLHPDSLNRKMKKEIGMGFHEYLLWTRIQ